MILNDIKQFIIDSNVTDLPIYIENYDSNKNHIAIFLINTIKNKDVTSYVVSLIVSVKTSDKTKDDIINEATKIHNLLDIKHDFELPPCLILSSESVYGVTVIKDYNDKIIVNMIFKMTIKEKLDVNK